MPSGKSSPECEECQAPLPPLTPNAPKSTTHPEHSCPCNHTKAPLSPIIPPKIPPRSNRRIPKTHFKSLKLQVVSISFESLRDLFLQHFWKAARASARGQSLSTEPPPALMHFPLPERPQDQGFLLPTLQSLNLPVSCSGSSLRACLTFGLMLVIAALCWRVWMCNPHNYPS